MIPPPLKYSIARRKEKAKKSDAAASLFFVYAF